MIQLQECDKSMAEEFDRLKSEIYSFKFRFNRQEIDIEILKSIGKGEWQEFFEKLFGENARRLDVRFNSQAH